MDVLDVGADVDDFIGMSCVRARRRRRTTRRTSSVSCISPYVSFSHRSSRVDCTSLLSIVYRSGPDLVHPLLKASPHHPSPVPLPFRTNTTHTHRSKGLTELGLARLGYADTIVFRPGFLRGAERPEKRLTESVIGYVRSPLFFFFPSSID